MKNFKFIIFSVLIFSCKEKQKMSYISSNSETAWRYYPYDEEAFNSAFKDIGTTNNGTVDINIVRSLSKNLETSYQEVRKDSQILALYASMMACEDAMKYVNLYYERAKLKLSHIENDIIGNGRLTDDNFTQLKEYYIRYKSAVFNRNTWFLLNKYYISQDFFKKFVDKKTYEALFYPLPNTEYLNKSMYLDVILNKAIAERILNNINKQGIKEIDFDQKDRIFLSSLKGVLNSNYLIAYSNE